MKTSLRFAAPLLVLALGATPALSLHAQQYGPPPPQQGYGGQQGYGDRDRGGWDAPPNDIVSDIARRGFHDGIETARSDFQQRSRPDPNRSQLFRHPPVPRGLRNDYRNGFQRGYDVASHHLYDGDRGYDHGGYQH